MKKYPRAQEIGDFTADWRMVSHRRAGDSDRPSQHRRGVGAACGLIGLFTNLCYYHR